jgi:hypothetical protein
VLAQFIDTQSSSSDSTQTALIVIGILNAALLVVFLVMAANIGRIRKAIESDVLGLGLSLTSYRFCQFCNMTCAFTATVCHRCGREIGAWVMHDGAWWTKRGDGAWGWRYQGSWYPPDATHQPPPGEVPPTPAA